MEAIGAHLKAGNTSRPYWRRLFYSK